MPNQTQSEQEQIPWVKFLESTPPYVYAKIPDLIKRLSNTSWIINHPQIQLYCVTQTCEGGRFFGPQTDEFCPGVKRAYDYFLTYQCKNCGECEKTYSLRILVPNLTEAIAVKMGEFPPFGPPTPARVISLIGPDIDIFLKGRRSENQGLGIGAFGYYRRVIEKQKSRIISEMGKVAARLGANKTVLDHFERAALETQFSRAVHDIKDAIPQSLLIDGQNPLTLLHTALSEGLHAQTDEECLELATDIRIVMTELADRISSALKDEAELKQSVSRLLNRRKIEKEAATENTDHDSEISSN
jgi:hypothetical protein